MATTIPSGTQTGTYTITNADTYILQPGEVRTQTTNRAINATITTGFATIDIEGTLINTASALNGTTGIRSGQQDISAALGNGGLITIGQQGLVQTKDAVAIIGAYNATTSQGLSITNLGQVISQTSNSAGTISTTGNRGATGAFAISLNAVLGDPNGGDNDFTSGGIINNGSASVTTALIRSDSADAIRLGAHQTLNNYGTIEGAGQVNDAATNNVFNPPGGNTITATRYDISRGVRITNDASKDIQINNYGTIRGSQHGVDVGEDEVFGIRVDNKAGALIEGKNGSGVGADTTGEEANTVVVTNAGTIRGAYAPKFDRAGYATLDGDGDGVDVDGGATITNLSTGIIEATGAGGFDSGGRANASEGISIGGGIITNSGIIRGASTGIVVNNDANANRSGVTETTITNYASGSITGQAGYAIRLENKEPATPGPETISDDTILNYGTITGNGAVPTAGVVTTQNGNPDANSTGTLDGVTYTGTGDARFIRGDGSAIQMGEGDDTLTNYGTITAVTSGRAVNMEGGDDTLNLYTGSTVGGRLDGGAGDDDTLNLLLDDRTGSATSNEGANSGVTSGTLTNVTRFETLNVQSGTWTIGDAQTYEAVNVSSVLKVDADLDADVTVKDGGTLTGSGSTGALSVQSGGTLSAGDTVGTLETGDLTLATGATLKAAIGGTGDGESDQLVVTGTVVLGGATLEASFSGNFKPNADDTFVLIDNDGTDLVSGTFSDANGAALAEGATVTIDGRDLTLSYAGGDGNDVTLTAQNVLPTANDLPLDVTQRTTTVGNVIDDAVDTDVDGGTLVITEVKHGATTVPVGEDTEVAGDYGTLTIDDEGGYSYDADVEGTLAVGDTATDTFTYTISDGQGGTASADIAITVTGSGVGDAGENIFLLTGSGTSAEGKGGDDTYYVDQATDQVIEAANGGDDTVETTVSYTLADGQEIETLRLAASTGSAALSLTGNEFANTLIGNDGANVLDGGTGADTLQGGLGNDRYYVDELGDVVEEEADGGTDTVYARGDFTLGAGQSVEYLRADAGTTGITLTGNELVDRIYSGAGNDTLAGKEGSDFYFVNNEGDVVHESAGEGNDTVYASSDYTLGAGESIEMLRANAGTTGLNLTGNELANRLISGAGDDTLAGGDGNDLYFVNGLGDSVKEVAGEGTDTVYASASFTLGDGQAVENLRANAGSTGITLTGNDLANRFFSGAGDDTLIGGGGNDIFYVNGLGDSVQEAANGGTDTVYASVSYALDAGQAVEYLRANAGTTGITLTGNELANRLYSGAGEDTLKGGDGNDYYYVNDDDDVVQESAGEGTDTVYASSDYTLAAGASVEGLRANAGTTGLSLTGNANTNSIYGGGGNDQLEGGLGHDSLFGGAGSDTFVFGPANAASQDKIVDFLSGTDHIGINAEDYGLTVGNGLNANGSLDADYFEVGSKATKSHAEFVFNSAKKLLLWDADGAGGDAAIAVSSFTIPSGSDPTLFLKSSDFLLLA